MSDGYIDQRIKPGIKEDFICESCFGQNQKVSKGKLIGKKVVGKFYSWKIYSGVDLKICKKCAERELFGTKGAKRRIRYEEEGLWP